MSTHTLSTPGRVPVWLQRDLLRKAREDSGLGQGDLARLIGVSRNTVSNAERGAVVVRRPVLIAWAMATGVSLDWLESAPVAEPECAPWDSNPEPSDSGPGAPSSGLLVRLPRPPVELRADAA